jgi:hypothetical protein
MSIRVVPIEDAAGQKSVAFAPRFLSRRNLERRPFAWHVTSDHRVAGSSPAGCRSSFRADRRAIFNLKNRTSKALLAKVLPLLRSTPILPKLENTVQVAARRGLGQSYLETYEPDSDAMQTATRVGASFGMSSPELSAGGRRRRLTRPRRFLRERRWSRITPKLAIVERGPSIPRKSRARKKTRRRSCSRSTRVPEMPQLLSRA